METMVRSPQTLARACVRLKARPAHVRVRLKTRAQMRPACACAREPKNACAGEAQTGISGQRMAERTSKE